MTVLRTVERFEESGSVENVKKELPKPVRSGSTEQRVLQAVQQSHKSTRRLSGQLGISRTTFRRILKNAQLRLYRPELLQKLSEDDPDRRIEFSEWFLEQKELDDQFVVLRAAAISKIV